MSEVPRIVVIAGPNGAGKTTVAPFLLKNRLQISHYVNADTIAAGLSAFNQEGVAFEAGRLMLRRLRKLRDQGESFAFETTLATRSYARWLRKAKASAFQYKVDLLFIALSSCELAQGRVSKRVASGGHDIPPDVISRRFSRGRANFRQLYLQIADTWSVFDNSSLSGPRLIARGERDNIAEVTDRVFWQDFFGSEDS